MIALRCVATREFAKGINMIIFAGSNKTFDVFFIMFHFLIWVFSIIKCNILKLPLTFFDQVVTNIFKY